MNSKQSDPRRQAWRKFYLENYPHAVKAVGNEKNKIDEYIVSLWKTIGSKGRELYISNLQKSQHDLSNTSSSPQQLKHCPLESANGENEGKRPENPQPPIRSGQQDNGSWPRLLTSRFCQCVMLTRKKIRLTVGETITLSVSPKHQGKLITPAVVRLTKQDRDFARLDSSFSSALGAAMQTKFVNATCSIVEPPVGVGMFNQFYCEVSVFVEEQSFLDHNPDDENDDVSATRMAMIRMIRELNLIPDLSVKRVQDLNSNCNNGNGIDEAEESYVTSVKLIQATDAKDFQAPQDLKSSLREYQKAGVRWMINRENFGSATQPSEEGSSACAYPWKKCSFESGAHFFANAVTGELRLQNVSSCTGGPRGGILADEMGLGKTVQCIACLLQDFEDTPLSRTEPSVNNCEDEDFEESTAITKATRKTNEKHVIKPPTKKRKRNKCSQGAQQASAKSVLMTNARDSCTLGGTLIVCPTSLVTQWMDELNFHIKPNSLQIMAHYGNVRGDETSICAKFADVVVTSYGILASEFNPNSDGSSQTTDLGPLFRLRWRRVILDEAHTIKSRSTRWAKAAYHLEAERRWCITGTVIHNHINDVFSLIHFLRLEPWSTWNVWAKSIADPLESKDGTAREAAMSLVRDILSSIILRRKKSTKDSDGNSIVQMTKKSVEIVSLTPSAEEQRFYSALHARTKLKFNSFLAQGNVLKNYASVLEMLLRLRQACDHPYLVIKAAKPEDKQHVGDYQSLPDSCDFDFVTSKKRAPDDKVGEPGSQECPICLDIADSPVRLPECGHILCRICLTEALNISRVCPLCKTATKWEDVDDDSGSGYDFDPKRWASSAKIDELMKDLTERQNLRKSRGRAVGKSVVFSQFVSMLNITEIALRRARFSFLRIDGSVPQSKRADILKQFSSERELSSNACNVLLLSTRTGGVGLNLVSASFAVILDIHWNPQVDAQAQDRIHRHGQTRDVQIKRYIVKDSVEEKLLGVQARKEKLAEGALEEANEGDEKQARLAELKLLFSR